MGRPGLILVNRRDMESAGLVTPPTFFVEERFALPRSGLDDDRAHDVLDLDLVCSGRSREVVSEDDHAGAVDVEDPDIPAVPGTLCPRTGIPDPVLPALARCEIEI
jgi:hypothetical protein